MIEIDPDRLLADLSTLRGFGASGTGVVRQSLTPPDLDARRWLRDRMDEAGLEATIDGVGNVIGRSPLDGPALLIGSHADTQPTGGWLDGALGVIYGLEVARACRAVGGRQRLAVDATAWVDEEGTFGNCLGSRSFCGLVSSEELVAACNDEGVPFPDALRSAGLSGRASEPDFGRYCGYLEAHIEQGPELDRTDRRIGVVTGIVGCRNLHVRLTGQQNHAGTTPMADRRDAGAGLIELAHTINEAFATSAGPRTVWTIGRVEFHPGASSIVSGRAEAHLQFRDPEPQRLIELEQLARRLAADADDRGAVAVSVVEARPPIEPMAMDGELQAHLVDAARRLAPEQWTSMPSAAVHDAMFVAEVMPAAMLFVPSIGGISHDFAEDTNDDDIVLGCQVLATAVETILANR